MVSYTLSLSILYYMEIVGNYLHSVPWSASWIIYNHLQNSFDKIIVFQIDLSSIYHSFYIFITILCRGIFTYFTIYFLYFLLWCLQHAKYLPLIFNPLFSNFSTTFFQFLPFSLNPSKSPLFLHFHYFSPISLKKTLRRKWHRSTSLFKPLLTIASYPKWPDFLLFRT